MKARTAASPPLRMSDRPSPDPASLDAPLAANNAGNDATRGIYNYPGGKNGAGIYQRLINLMPPHRVYIEPFLGSGAVLWRKKPAIGGNIGIDVDAGIIAAHDGGGRRNDHITLITTNAIAWLAARTWQGDELVYCDPPYLGSTRARAHRPLYRCEMMGEGEHSRLLQILTSIPAMVVISGYRNRLYDSALNGWRRIEYQTRTRGGTYPEWTWMNFEEPSRLHDYRFLGRDFHDRCRIARKINRLSRKLAALPQLERMAIIDAFSAGDRDL